MKEDTLRDLGTQCGILLRIFQEVDHFREFFFFFIAAGYICKSLPILLLTAQTCPRLAETGNASDAASVIAMFYIMHSSPFDAELGTVDATAR